MTLQLDETHHTHRKSWVTSANGHADFPIQNLPLGIFSVANTKGDTPRGGVAIGDEVFDLKAACDAQLFSGDAEKAARAASSSTLNDLMALGAGPRNPNAPQFADHCFTGDYPTPLVDRDHDMASKEQQLSLLDD